MNVFGAIGRFAVRFRWVILVVWIIGVPVAAHAMPTLSSVAKTDNTAFLPANSPSEKAAQLATPFQPKSQGQVLLLASRQGSPLTAADRASIARAVANSDRVATVRGVRDVGTSADGEAEEITIETSLPPYGGGDQATDLVTSLRQAADHSDAPPGLSYHLTGNIPISVDEQNATKHTQGLTQELAVLFIIVLLLLVFRAALAPLVTLLPAALALVLAGPLIAEATHIGVQVSALTQILLVVIVLGAGTDYGLFLIFRTREEMRRGRDPRDAVVVAVTRVGESITFSAATVIAALVSLLLASFGLYKGLGPGLAIGVGVVLVANLTLLPALLALLGKAVFWPLVPKVGEQRRNLWGVVAGRVVKRPVPTLIMGLALFGGLALALLDYSPGGFGSPTVSATSDSSEGQAVLTAHFASAEANPTNVLFRFAAPVWDSPQILAEADRDLSASPLFTGVTGALDPNGSSAVGTSAGGPTSRGGAGGGGGGGGGGTSLIPTQLATLYRSLGPPRDLPPAGSPAQLAEAGGMATYEAYRATSQFVSSDGRTVQFYTSLRAGDPSSNAALNAVPAIRAAVTAIARDVGATTSGVAGEAPALNDVAAVSAHDLDKIIPVVLLVLALILALVLRSLVAPLYLVLSVGLSYLASLGLAVLIFVVIGGQGGINFVLPFFMFIFIMALGEDYNILVMSRIREEAHTLRLRDAVQRAVQATGSTVTSAGLILAGTFAVLTVAGGTQVREIGVGLASGILLDTFFVRTLLVPSVVVLIGRWNWWPSRLWREEQDDGIPVPPMDRAEPAEVGAEG